MHEELIYFELGNVVKTGSSFYDRVLPTALEKTQEYAGKKGKIASMLDICKARILADKERFVWNTWFATVTGEYSGLSRGGSPVFVVAHGVGPFTSPERIRQARRKGLINGAGRIVPEEVYDLLDKEDGKKIVVLDGLQVQKLPSGQIEAEDAKENILFKARLGKHTNDYLSRRFEEVWGGRIGNYHDLENIDWEIPQGRLLFAGNYSYDLVGGNSLKYGGRFVGIRAKGAELDSSGNQGIIRTNLEDILTLRKFVPKGSQKLFEEEAREICKRLDLGTRNVLVKKT